MKLETGWTFHDPEPGMRVFSANSGRCWRFEDGEWKVANPEGNGLVVDGQQVVAMQQPEIADPTGGTTIDSEARTAINSLLETLRTHGLIAGAQ